MDGNSALLHSHVEYLIEYPLYLDTVCPRSVNPVQMNITPQSYNYNTGGIYAGQTPKLRGQISPFNYLGAYAQPSPVLQFQPSMQHLSLINSQQAPSLQGQISTKHLNLVNSERTPNPQFNHASSALSQTSPNTNAQPSYYDPNHVYLQKIQPFKYTSNVAIVESSTIQGDLSHHKSSLMISEQTPYIDTQPSLTDSRVIHYAKSPNQNGPAYFDDLGSFNTGPLPNRNLQPSSHDYDNGSVFNLQSPNQNGQTHSEDLGSFNTEPFINQNFQPSPHDCDGGLVFNGQSPNINCQTPSHDLGSVQTGEPPNHLQTDSYDNGFVFTEQTTNLDRQLSAQNTEPLCLEQAPNLNGASFFNTNFLYPEQLPNIGINLGIVRPSAYANSGVPINSEGFDLIISQQVHSSAHGMTEYDLSSTPPSQQTLSQSAQSGSDTPIGGETIQGPQKRNRDTRSAKIRAPHAGMISQPISFGSEVVQDHMALNMTGIRKRYTRRSTAISNPRVSRQPSHQPIASGSGMMQASIPSGSGMRIAPEAPRKRIKKPPRLFSEMKDPCYCPYVGCSKLCDGQSELDMHMHKHDVIPRYKCPVPGCGVRARFPSDIVRHDKEFHAATLTHRAAKTLPEQEARPLNLFL